MSPLLRPQFGRCSALSRSFLLGPDGLLRGLHLDTACAPALTWQLTRSGTKARSAQSECPRFQGNRARHPGTGTGRHAQICQFRAALRP